MKAEQIQKFESVGLTCLRGAIDAEAALAIRDRIWDEVERRGPMRRDQPSTWRRVPPALVKDLRVSGGLFEPLMSETVREGIDALLGPGNWQRPAVLGQLLMSPPNAVDWVLPHNVWHTDFPAPGWVGDVQPGVQFFALLDRLESRQGGTLFVGGSHRLTRDLPERSAPDYPGHSAQLRKALKMRVPWLRELWKPGPAESRAHRFMAEASEHEGVPLRVLETTGEPGDVFFMHPWLLHNASPNCGQRMRVVATERLIASDVRLHSFNRDAEAEPQA